MVYWIRPYSNDTIVIKMDLETNEVVGHLQALGLNKYEASVYSSLIYEGSCSAKTLSNITGVPYGKIYEVIESLSQKGFCVILPTKPMKVKARDPTGVLKQSWNAMEQKFSTIEDSLKKHLAPVFMEGEQKDQKNQFFILNGRANIYQKSLDFVEKAEKSLYFHTSENGLKRLGYLKEALERAKNRGVDITISTQLCEDNREDAEALSFCTVIEQPFQNSHFLSSDGKQCIVIEAKPDDENYLHGRDNGLWSTSENFVAFLEMQMKK